MPLYLKPGMRATVYLQLDEKDDPRPEFYCRALTKDEQQELADAIDSMYDDVQSMREVLDKAYGLLAKHIDGWKNLPDDFELSKLNYFEVKELLSKIAYGQGLNFEEKKG